MQPAEDPTFFPSGGVFHDPIAVSLISDDDAVVFYTIDGTTPDESSSFVMSGELIVLEESTTIRAIAAHDREYFDAFASAEVEASFVVHTTGTMDTKVWLLAIDQAMGLRRCVKSKCLLDYVEAIS